MVNVSLLKQIEVAEGSKAKGLLLKRLADDKVTQQLIRYALDPHLTFGVTVDPGQLMNDDSDELLLGGTGRKRKKPTRTNEAQWWDAWFTLLDRLSDRVLTGTKAKSAVTSILSAAPSDDHVDWACRALHKDLACGVQASTVAKVFPSLLRIYRPALAQPYHGQDFSGPGFLEPKFDGIRLFVDGDPLSRKGKYLYGLQHIKRELAKYLKLDYWIVDGEFVGQGTFEETTEHAHNDSVDRPVIYHIFDLIPRVDWDARSTQPLAERKRVMWGVLPANGNHFALVPHMEVEDVSHETLIEWRDHYVHHGYNNLGCHAKCDGIIWKRASSPYSFKRGDDWLKFKPRDEVDAVIVGFYEGEGKYEGALGGFVIKLDNGQEQKCGGGFTDAQRKAFWAKRKVLVGSGCRVAFTERTGKDKLRHPVFFGLRDDK